MLKELYELDLKFRSFKTHRKIYHVFLKKGMELNRYLNLVYTKRMLKYVLLHKLLKGNDNQDILCFLIYVLVFNAFRFYKGM